LVTLPLPDDPVLAAWASSLNEEGFWASVWDASWRQLFVTDELRLGWGDEGAVTIAPLGCHFFSAEAMQLTARIGGPEAVVERRRARFLDLGGYVLSSMPGGREELRRVVDPALADLVDQLQPQDIPAAQALGAPMTFAGTHVGGSRVLFRIDDGHGHVAGFCTLLKPAAGMSQLAAAAATADLAHLERMRVVEQPERRPAAVLMADLEASSPLARRLSTAQYFAFNRRFTRAADQCIIDAGGIVGRHAGDGVVGFFLAETADSESAAATSCITAARSLRDVLADIATRSELVATEVSMRFGLHWGATLYVGRILTGGRSEVTALGDEMNEAARIEACAAGGRTLASKSLIERLNRADAEALDIDATHAKYSPLADLSTASEKTLRDAPAIVVCDV
jgi:class 3 adenylate cyclase